MAVLERAPEKSREFYTYIKGLRLGIWQTFMEQGDLQEMRWRGAYYTWTNKTIWSRIDRSLINIYWY